MTLENNLIKKCVCDNSKDFSEDIINDIPIKKCNVCGVIHQVLSNFTELDLSDLYSKKYHRDFQNKITRTAYQDRYEHDRNISKLRLLAYHDYIKPNMGGLDIGSSNSAFVHECIENNIRCTGLEPGENIGDPTLTIRGRLETVDLLEDQYDFVTMHDAIEHMLDPLFSLQKVSKILKNNGILIVDLPDFHIPEGRHHWRPIEHLWYFTELEFIKLLETTGFKVKSISKPIPGKLVFYAVVSELAELLSRE